MYELNTYEYKYKYIIGLVLTFLILTLGNWRILCSVVKGMFLTFSGLYPLLFLSWLYISVQGV